jgi:hypothetical protein
MRLWTVHPRHLDAKGLVALWREGLLAQKVLRGKTKGYRHHPQLHRFQAAQAPVAVIAAYLAAVCDEAERRGYRFARTKIGRRRFRGKLTETTGQLLYEWRHLKRKLARRDPTRLKESRGSKRPAAHPLFRLTPGPVQAWEITDARRNRR